MKVRAAIVALMCALATGCAHEVSSRGDAATFPPRPVDIRTGDLAPCSMLSPAQGSALGLDAGDAGAVSVNGQPSLDCVWLSDTDLSYSAQTIPIGAEVAVTEQRAAVIEVNGFGAVRSVLRELTGGAPTCQVTVDAGPNQSIRIQAQATGERPRRDDEMCAIATDVAGMVMITVVATAR